MSGLSLAALLAVIDVWAQPSTAVIGSTVVAAAAVLAALLARSRGQIGRDRERFAMLTAVAEMADATCGLPETVAALNGVVVPAAADICIVDVISSGELQRLSVEVAGGAGDIAAAIAARPPGTADALGDPEQPRLIRTFDDALLQKLATDAEDLEQLGALGALSAVVLPLRARGRRLGSLTLIVTTKSGRRYNDDDLAFAKLLASRTALALDNAGLFSELETIEAQLTAALSTLAEAVTVQRAGGALIYANEAAARMLDFASAQELLATPAEQVAAAFATTHEDGSPLRTHDLPGWRVLTGERDPEPLTVRAVDRRTGEIEWRVMKASGVYDSDGDVKLVVNVIEDISEVKRAELTQRLLARAGELLSSSMDYERTLQQVAELAVPELAAWCTVGMPDGHGYVRVVAVAHADPDKLALARYIAERYPTPADAAIGTAQVIREGRPQLLNEISDELLAVAAQDDEHLRVLRELGLRAALIVPMTVPGKVLGTLTLLSDSGRRFRDADVALAEELARRAGTAVETARLYTERSNIARTLQTSLLPGRLPHMPGWTAATLYRPAGDENWVGGDFYDAFAVHRGWLAIVGDVAGHGAEAAALTGLARYTLRTAATLLDDPLGAIRTLNSELLALDAMSLCSVAAVLLCEDEDRTATAEIVCAGHPLPLLVRGGAVRPIGSFSPMLGAYPIDGWERTSYRLEPGDVLVLFTDGVFDTVGEGGRFGEERLERTLDGVADAADAVARIDAALNAFEVGEQADDTAVLAVQRVPVAAVARRR